MADSARNALQLATDAHLLTCTAVNINIVGDAIHGVQTSTVCTQVNNVLKCK